MWRYAQESDVTIIETIKSAHQAAERIAQIALDANQFLSEMQEAALEAGKPTKGQIITLKSKSGRWYGKFEGTIVMHDGNHYLTWANEHINFGRWDCILSGT